MLVRNGRSVFQNPGKFSGSTYGDSGNILKGGYRNRDTGLSNRFSGYPNGVLAPGAFLLSLKSGSISSYTLASGSITGDADLIPARNLLGSATLTIVVLNAQLDQIVSGSGSSSMAISVSNAALAAAAGATASGSMTISVDDALCGAIFSVTASSTLAIAADNKTLTALGHMEAEAGGATPLSPEGLSTELLDNQDIETGYSLREALRLILSALAGKVSGAGTSTITIRSVTDGTNRIVATVDSNGNRSSVTLDVGEE